MGATPSVKMAYADAVRWFRLFVDEQSYREDFKQIDKDFDNTLSFIEVRTWAQERSKTDPSWRKLFLDTGSGPVLNIAHKMACQHGDIGSSVSNSHVVHIGEFRTLLLHMFAVSNFWCHFNNADRWEESGGEVGAGDLNVDAFRLGVRTFNAAHAKEEVTDEEIQEYFDTIDSNQSGGIGFFEVCNYCCRFIDVSTQASRRTSSMPASPMVSGKVTQPSPLEPATDLMRHVSSDPAAKAFYDGMSAFERSNNAMKFLEKHVAVQLAAAKDAAKNEKLNAIRRQFHTVDSLIGNPLCLGYLLRYCQHEPLGVLIHFISAVDMFKSLFEDDMDVWSTRWRDIDAMVKVEDPSVEQNLINTAYWPSTTDHAAVAAQAQAIFDRYLADDAPASIGALLMVTNRTAKRIKLLYLYGPSVFDEACTEPIKTAKKDIFPRFLASDMAKTLVENISACETLPSPADVEARVVVPAADLPRAPLNAAEDVGDLPSCLAHVTTSRTLYLAFAKFLQQNDPDAVAKLQCLRLIATFDECAAAPGGATAQATELCWLLYKFFLAQWSPFDLASLDAKVRRQLLASFVDPPPGTFDPVKAQCDKHLKLALKVFMTTKAYHLG